MIELNSTFFAQILNFLILVILLRAVAYKPVLKILKEREDRIAASIDKADADAAEAAKTLEAYKAELAGARTKAQEIMDLAEKRASEEHEASIQATKRAHAVEQLKGEVVTLALAAAGKIVQKNLEKSDNDAIIGEFIAKLDAHKIGDATC